MSDTLVSRLRGIYEVGPDGELGHRTFFVPPIQLEAAAEIERLNARLKVNAAWEKEELIHDLAQCNHEIERLNARFKVLQESLRPTVGGYITESHRIKDEITAALYGEACDE